MATNIEVISDALRELNVISEVASASAEQGAHGLRKLNEMMETWTENDIEIGYFKQSSTTDDCPVPEWALKGVKAALSIDLAPTYGATVSAELAKKLEDGFGTIQRKCMVEKMRPADMSHMPQGEGKFYREGRILTDS